MKRDHFTHTQKKNEITTAYGKGSGTHDQNNNPIPEANAEIRSFFSDAL